MCVNNLRMETHFGPLSVSVVKVDGTFKNQTQKRFSLEFNYYKNFTDAMFGECKKFDIMYKYMILHRKAGELSELFQKNFNKKWFREELAFDSRMPLITIDRTFFYEFMVFIQTTFDSGPFLVGNYILDPSVKYARKRSSSEAFFFTTALSPNLDLFASRWSFYVGREAFVASFFVQTGSHHFDPENIFYVLIDSSKKSNFK
jgi:hypothetical protein